MSIVHRALAFVSQVVTCLVAISLTNALSAQEEISSVSDEGDRRSRMIDEVVVTAQRREQSFQEVPISLQAFSSDKLDAMGIVSPEDLQRITPGLTIGSTSALTVVYLRGVGTDAFVPTADVSIATYIDGIYQPFNANLVQAFGDVKRIEVLKGPQGTLFGRNSTGGAINIISEPPGYEFARSASVAVESFSGKKLQFSVRGPVSEKLQASFSVFRNTSEEYYEYKKNSPVQSFPLDNLDQGGRIRARWLLTDNMDITVSAYKVETEGAHTGLTVQEKPKPLGQMFGVERQNQRPWKASSDVPAGITTENTLIYKETNWLLDWFDVKLLASDQRANLQTITDFDGSPQDTVYFYSPKTDRGGIYYDSYTAELQLLSNETSWFSPRLEWIGGLHYLKGDVGFSPVVFSLFGSDQTIGTDTSPPLPVQGLPPPAEVLPELVLSALEESGSRLAVFGQLDTIAYAAFFQGSYDLWDWLRITLGGRYQYEKRELYRSETFRFENDGTRTKLLEFHPKPAIEQDFSPKISLESQLPDGLVYLSWQKAFKSGTFNPINVSQSPDFVKPEEITAVELGAKLQLFDNALQFNAAVFHYDIKDLQVQFISLQSGGAVSFENAAQATSKGFDFDFMWAVTPNFILTGGGAYLDSTYDKYPEAQGFDEVTGLHFDDGDFSGNRIVRTPEITATAGVNYTFYVSDVVFELGADAYHNTGFFFDSQNVTEQKAYTTYSARASVLYEPWDVRLSLYGQNLNSAESHIFKFPNDFGTIGKLRPPATYGLKLKWSW